MRIIKVLQPSDYSFEKIIEYKETGKEAFIVSLFGYEYLVKEKCLNVTVIYPDDRKKITKALTKCLKLEGRNLILQFEAIRKSSQYDIIYYATDRHPYLIALARILGICKCPILMVSHFTFNPKTVNSIIKKIILKLERRLVYKGIDRIVFASQNILNVAMEQYKLPKRHCTNSCWGADIDFFSRKKDFKKPFTNYYLAAGSANRDYHTLIEAFKQMPNKNLVLSVSSNLIKEEFPLPNNIKIFDYKKYGMEVFVRLRDLYQNALAVLIPVMKENHVPNGASVLVEAMACGKAIFATDLPTNFIQIKEEGIGKVAKIHCVNDWIKIISETNEDDLKVMGKHANEIAKNTYNYKNFANNIVTYIKELISENNEIYY